LTHAIAEEAQHHVVERLRPAEIADRQVEMVHLAPHGHPSGGRNVGNFLDVPEVTRKMAVRCGEQAAPESGMVLSTWRILRSEAGRSIATTPPGRPAGLAPWARRPRTKPLEAAGRDRRAGEHLEHLLAVRTAGAAQRFGAGDAAMLQVERALDPELDAAGIDLDLSGIESPAAVQGAQVLEVDAVGHGDPGVPRPLAAGMRLVVDGRRAPRRGCAAREVGRSPLKAQTRPHCSSAG
jgi:hypothetical protein